MGLLQFTSLTLPPGFWIPNTPGHHLSLHGGTTATFPQGDHNQEELTCIFSLKT